MKSGLGKCWRQTKNTNAEGRRFLFEGVGSGIALLKNEFQCAYASFFLQATVLHLFFTFFLNKYNIKYVNLNNEHCNLPNYSYW